jgi:uncharacterized membrane protein
MATARGAVLTERRGRLYRRKRQPEMDEMRNGAAFALVLATSVAGCGDRADPVPAASDSPVTAPSEAAAPTPVPQDEGLSGAQAPTATATMATEAVQIPAAKAPAAASVVPARLRALGTEPFWSARIDGDALTYTTPEDQKGQRATLSRRDQASGTELSGKLGGAAVHIMVTKRSCSDGMSDRTYPFTVVLTLGSDRREGCAS